MIIVSGRLKLAPKTTQESDRTVSPAGHPTQHYFSNTFPTRNTNSSNFIDGPTGSSPPRGTGPIDELTCMYTNVDGINTTSKSDIIELAISKENPQIIFISETKLSLKESFAWYLTATLTQCTEKTDKGRGRRRRYLTASSISFQLTGLRDRRRYI